MRAALQSSQLRLVTLATVNRQHMEPGHARGVALKGFGDLNRQFAGGRQHQCLR